jgi:hypothetical protein
MELERANGVERRPASKKCEPCRKNNQSVMSLFLFPVMSLFLFLFPFRFSVYNHSNSEGVQMSWIIGCLPPKEPELLEFFFTVLGRALYAANAFEGKCRHILQLIRFVNLYNQTGDADATFQLAAALKDKVLAGTIAEIHSNVTFRADEIGLLEKARDARNFIAHEGGQIGSIVYASERTIYEQLDVLRSRVKELAKGDNVASKWEYGICEKEPTPYGIYELYPAALEEWIFGGPACYDFARIYWNSRQASASGC